MQDKIYNNVDLFCKKTNGFHKIDGIEAIDGLSDFALSWLMQVHHIT